MKTLHLLRHAKAVPGLPTEDDHARALAPQGAQQARTLGLYLRMQGIRPQHVLCSSSVRTRQTLSCLLETYGHLLPTEFLDTLYHATANQMIQTLRALPESMDQALVIGHNPGIHQLASLIAIEGDRRALEESTLHYPPCTLASFTLHIDDWSRLKPYCGEIQAFLTPEALSQITLAA